MVQVFRLRLRTNEVFLLYIIFCGVLTNIFPMPEIVKSFVSLPSVILLPFLFGDVCLTILRVITKKIELNCFFFEDFASYLVYCTLIGLYFIWVLASLLMLAGQAYLIKNLHVIVILVQQQGFFIQEEGIN